jgi:hypothetical protein
MSCNVLKAALLAISLLPASMLLSEELQTHSSVTILPENRLFKRLLADPKETQLSVRLLLKRDTFGGSIGHSVGLFEYRIARLAVQMRIEGNALLLSRIQSPDFPVQSTDYTVTIPVDMAYGNLSARVRIGHISSHLGDNFNRIEDVEDALLFGPDSGRRFADPEKFSREFLSFLLSVQNRNWRYYAGTHWDFHIVENYTTSSSKRLAFQVGTEWQGRRNGQLIYPYAAVDVKCQQQFRWDPDYNIQVGWAIENGSGKRARLAFEVFRGYSYQGQFFQRFQKDANIILAFDF